MSEIKNLEPKNLWNNFDMICSIAHPSKKEDKLRDALVLFAKTHNIECKVDKVGNIIMKKPATKGMENKRGVILQAHIDMVPQKNSDISHNFETDPILPWIDNAWVRAKGTTLGADNGIGVSAILAVLEDESIPHGDIEALFTIDEETGMTGAFGLEPNMFKGDILLNLDSETEGELYVGCAGGIDGTFVFDFKKESIPAGYSAFTLNVKGLKGGHSGMDIILQRANANKVLFRLFYALEELQLRISSIDGGSLRNAIPREAFSTILIPTDKVAQAKEKISSVEQEIKKEYSLVEPSIEISLNPTALPKDIMDLDTQKRLIRSIYACPNGVIRMSDSMKDLTETSTNLAIVKSEENTIKISCLIRSSVDSAKMDLATMMESVFALGGAKCKFEGGYPGWKPNMDSPILKTMQKTYEDLYGVTPKVMAIHAGLECGLLGGVYPSWDMISFGPTIMNPHSPDERVNIESVQKFWDYLNATLKNIPNK
ncbi:MAG: aminoacyl-histidine dipeptidase [Bacteroidales bacterium]|jgi:dipeptidase D|nr:aminoacyl-histidine dipeptidase [Bacteroidales bacterium]